MENDLAQNGDWRREMETEFGPKTPNCPKLLISETEIVSKSIVVRFFPKLRFRKHFCTHFCKHFVHTFAHTFCKHFCKYF